MGDLPLRLRLPQPLYAPDGDLGAAPPPPAVDTSPAPTPASVDTAASPPAADAASVAPPAAVPAADAAPVSAPAAPALAADAAPVAPAIAPSLLDTGATPPAPAEPAQAAEAAPASTDAPAEPAPAPYELTLPEGIELNPADEERIGALKSILGDVKAPPEKGQELLDLHYAAIRDAQTQMQAAQHEAYVNYMSRLVDETKSDPELGGARHQTAMAECMRVIREYGGDEANQARLLQEARDYGWGNSVAMLRMLHNVYSRAIQEGSPVITPPQRAPVLSREQRGLARYNGSAAR